MVKGDLRSIPKLAIIFHPGLDYFKKPGITSCLAFR